MNRGAKLAVYEEKLDSRISGLNHHLPPKRRSSVPLLSSTAHLKESAIRTNISTTNGLLTTIGVSLRRGANKVCD